ncbi:hypothetical protein AB0L71_09480 [Streptomyces sp. NPDC052052]|uniref:hypothetical protein n=1 Tax=Streptomyces sp. NPDC052052 TaxID=3154756 RepID=UPI00341925AB
MTGALSGLLAGSTAHGYWALQAVLAVGSVLAGYEHTGMVPGMLRGVPGGALFGTALVSAHAFTDWEPRVPMGDSLLGLVLFIAALGGSLGAVGGCIRSKRERAQHPAVLPGARCTLSLI